MDRDIEQSKEKGYTTEILTGAALVPVNRDAAPVIGAATEELEEMRREEEARRKQ